MSYVRWAALRTMATLLGHKYHNRLRLLRQLWSLAFQLLSGNS